MKSLDGFLMT